MNKYGYYLKSIFELIFGFINFPTVIGVFLAQSNNQMVNVKLRKPPLILKVRGKMDIWSVKETFIDKFYTKYGCEIQDGWSIVDIGSAIGEFSIYAANARPRTRVIAYEPYNESYNLMKENLSVNKLGNVKVIPRAVWKTPATLALDLRFNEPLQISSGQADQSKGAQIKVKAVSLHDVLSMNHLDQVDLLKMDCEGAEYDIILESASDVVKAFKRIVMEYHDGRDGRHHDQLVRHLRQMGYRVSVWGNAVHTHLGYLYAEQM